MNAGLLSNFELEPAVWLQKIPILNSIKLGTLCIKMHLQEGRLPASAMNDIHQ